VHLVGNNIADYVIARNTPHMFSAVKRPLATRQKREVYPLGLQIISSTLASKKSWVLLGRRTKAVSHTLNVTHYDNLTGSPTIDGRQYTQGSSDLPLASGRDMILYLKGPYNVQVQDIGTTISISLFTMNAQYVTECNVNSAT